MASLELLIFDLDGTLIDSQLDISNAVNATLKAYGVGPLPPSAIKPYVGTGVWPLVQHLLVQERGYDEESAFAAFLHHYGAHLLGQTRLYPHVNEVLADCVELPKVVLTNKHDSFVRPIVEGLGIDHHFAGLYGRHAFAERKPSPVPIQRICELHGTTPERALMVGDTRVDILAGRSAGARTCGVLFGYGSREELETAGADGLISSWTELPSRF